jgi:hypothetical protein
MVQVQVPPLEKGGLGGIFRQTGQSPADRRSQAGARERETRKARSARLVGTVGCGERSESRVSRDREKTSNDAVHPAESGIHHILRECATVFKKWGTKSGTFPRFRYIKKAYVRNPGSRCNGFRGRREWFERSRFPPLCLPSPLKSRTSKIFTRKAIRGGLCAVEDYA